MMCINSQSLPKRTRQASWQYTFIQEKVSTHHKQRKKSRGEGRSETIMSKADQVIHAFLHVPDKRPVLVFSHDDGAAAFVKQYPGAEVYHHKTHVFLPTPYGLELVLGGPNGETAFRKLTAADADR
jgi:hypothetical protein